MSARGEEVGDVGGNKVGDLGVDLDAVVEAGDVPPGGLGFGQGGEGVFFVEQHLALQIGGLDEVTIDQGESADASAGEEAGGGGSGCSNSNDGCVQRCRVFRWPAAPMPGKRMQRGITLGVGDGWGVRHQGKYTRGQSGNQAAVRAADTPSEGK